MFEKLEPSLELKRFLNQWKDKPHEPYAKDLAQHWTKVLGKDQDFFFDTLKMSTVPEGLIEKYQEIWARLRENGWRYFRRQDAQGHYIGPYHWYCMYPHLVRKKTDRTFSEGDQARWESEYYGEEFIKEA